MSKLGILAKPLTWFMALMVAAFLAGCGGNGSGGTGGGTSGGTGAGTPTAAGAGTGVGGVGHGPAPVNLGTAGNYVILAKTAISTTSGSAVTGDLGISPAAASFITGFGLVMDGTGCFSTSSMVTGSVYAADYNTGGCATPALLTTAVGDMLTAYTDAVGRAPDYTELAAGNIGGLNLGPATYKWSGVVTIPTDLTLTGGPNDVWIFQIGGGLTVSPGVHITLAGGALPQNIYWATVAAASLDTTSQFKGVLLSSTQITLKTGASTNGRLLAQTGVALDANAVTKP
jgi:hypothetical protein